MRSSPCLRSVRRRLRPRPHSGRPRGAPPRDCAGRLALGGRHVHRSLAGDDEVAAVRRSSKPTRSRTASAPGDELGAERRQRRPQPARRARSAKRRRTAGAPPSRAGGARAPLRPPATRPSAARRVAPSPRDAVPTSQRTAVGTDNTSSASSQPLAAIDGCAAAQSEHEPARAVVERGPDQLAKAATGGTQRVELLRGKQRESDRGSGLDDGAPVGKNEPARTHRSPQRVGRPRLAPRAAERCVKRLSRPLAAICNRKHVCDPAPARKPSAERVRRRGSARGRLCS